MKNSTNSTQRHHLSHKAICLAVGVLLTLLVSGTARADGYRGDRDWHEHEVRASHYWHGPHPAPGYVYAPPTVYAPPPVVESPGLNLILPLHFN